MAYRPNKKYARVFSIAIVLLGVIIVKRTNPNYPSIEGMNFQPPAYFGAGLIIVGIIGILLLGSGLARKN